MTDSKIVKSLFTGGAIVFTGLIISKIFGLLYRVIVGRALGPEEYGVISVMLAVSSVIGALAYIGVPNGVQKYVSEYRGAQDISGQVEMFRTGLILVTIPSFLTAIALFMLAPWISTEIFNERRAIWPLRLLALIIPLRAWRKVMVGVTEAHEEMQYTVYTNHIYANILKVILTVALVLMGYGYIGAAFAYVFAWGSAVVLATIFSYKVLPEAFKFSRTPVKRYKKLLNHSWPLFAAGLFSTIAGYIDTFMLQSFLGSREVGLYNAAYPLAAAITFAGTAFGSIYLSNASKLYGQGRKEELAKAYRLVVKWTSIIAVPSFSIVLAFPELLLQVFGEEYLEMSNVLRVLGLGFVLTALIGPIGKVIQAVEKTKYKLYLTLFIGTSNIVLNYILIPVYGIMGAAYATTLTFTLAFILKLMLASKLMNRQPFRLSTLKVIASGLLSIGIVHSITEPIFEINPTWFLVTGIILFGLLYLTLLMLFRTIEKDDIIIFEKIERKLGVKTELIQKTIEKAQQK